jgi:DNA-directed RNA polymerase specialized sigma24 family protein
MMPTSLAQQIAALIPYLRRFARALTGSQTSGDAYVAAVLETIVTDPSVLDHDLDLRVALYKAFCGLWQSVDVNLAAEGSGSLLERQVDRRLSVIAPRQRQAFLLATVEDFDID